MEDAATAMTDYAVQTDVYNGPLDLLLYLIRREEVDLYDIPIARVTEQYVRHVETLAAIDPNVAAEFLVLAATLMEIKSRMLLPRPPAEEGEVEDLSDPRLELVRQLLEYKKFKDASLELAEAADEQSRRWPRTPVRPAAGDAVDVDLDDVQVWDLVAAFNKLMASIGAGAASHDVVFDDTPIALHATDILDRLQGEGGELPFEAVFTGRSRAEMIGLFLAVLELMRQQRIRVVQERSFGPIRVILLSAEPITVGAEWEPAIREAALGEAGPSRDRQGAGSLVSRKNPLADARGSEKQPSRDPALQETGENLNEGSPVENRRHGESDEFEGEEDDESFAELDRIKTDVDMDAILGHDKPDRGMEDISDAGGNADADEEANKT